MTASLGTFATIRALHDRTDNVGAAGSFGERVTAETLAALAEAAEELKLAASSSESHCLNVDQNSALPMMAKA